MGSEDHIHELSAALKQLNDTLQRQNRALDQLATTVLLLRDKHVQLTMDVVDLEKRLNRLQAHVRPERRRPRG